MKPSSSTPAQIVTAVAAGVAPLYFLRGVLAPFFLALVITVVIHAIADVIVGLLPKAPHWIVRVLTGAVVSALIIVSFDVALHGLAELRPQAQEMALRLQELLQDAGSAVGVTEVPNLKVLLGNADLSGLVQGTLTSMTGALSSVGLVPVFSLPPSVPTDDQFENCYRRSIVEQGEKIQFDSEAGRPRRQRLCFGADHDGCADRGRRRRCDAHDWTGERFFLGDCDLPDFVHSGPWRLGRQHRAIAPALFALVQFPTIWQAATIFLAIQSINILGNFVMP